MTDTKVERLCQRIGSTRFIAKALNVHRGTVAGWRRTGVITPALRDRVMFALERAAVQSTDEEKRVVLATAAVVSHFAPKSGKAVHPSKTVRHDADRFDDEIIEYEAVNDPHYLQIMR